MGYLDSAGLAHLWGKIKGALAAKQPTLAGQPGQVVGFSADGSAATVQGWSGTQLLDNAYWTIPECIINQRGVTGTITTPGYFIDRWKLVSGSVTITAGGLSLNGTMVQILEIDPGQAVTASYLTDSGVLPAEYDSETKTFAITAEGTLIRAAKLELGSQQTLAYQDEDGNWVLNDPPPNKVLELTKCQSYYWKSALSQNKYKTTCFVAEEISNGNVRLRCTLQPPATMRIRPTFRINGVSPGGTVSMRRNSNGKNIAGTLAALSGFDISTDKLYRIWITSYTGDATLNEIYEGTIELDADL